MKVKVPNKIKVGAYTYGLTLNPHLHSDDGKYADCNHRTQQISIWTEAPPTVRYESLIHEVLHIAEFSCRIDVSDPDIDRIAYIMTELLQNNLGIELDWSDIKEIEEG